MNAPIQKFSGDLQKDRFASFLEVVACCMKSSVPQLWLRQGVCLDLFQWPNQRRYGGTADLILRGPKNAS